MSTSSVEAYHRRRDALKPAFNYFIDNRLETASKDLISDALIDAKLAVVLTKALGRVAGLEEDVSIIDTYFIFENAQHVKTPSALAARRDSLQLFINAVCAYCSSNSPDADINNVTSSLRSLLAPPRYTSTPTPSQHSEPKVTPVKANSASYPNSATLRTTLDPRVREELKGHLWITRDESFFEQFFPANDDLPEPSKFPTHHPEKAVVDWFNSYQQTWRESKSAASKQTWNWKASGSRVLIHPDTKRKVDLFMYPDDEQDTDYDWAKVCVVGELKNQQGLGDLNARVVVQLANYVKEMMWTQPGRRFVHGFTIINTNMRCWIFTRSGGVASQQFDLTNEDGKRLFSRVFNGYMRMTTKTLGLSHTIARELEVGKKQLSVKDCIHCCRAIVSRGTTCWSATTESFGNNHQTTSWVLKDSWRYSQRSNEGVLLRQCEEVGVKGIASYYSHEDDAHIESVHHILGRCLPQAAILNLDWKDEKTPSPYSSQVFLLESRSIDARQPRQSASQSRPTPKIVKPNTGSGNKDVNSAIPEEIIKYDYNTTAGQGITLIPDRIHTRVVLSRGLQITKFTSALQLVEVMRDGIRGHYSLLTVGRILHRDISTNNIMITTEHRPDDYKGFLIDLDLAVPINNEGACGAPERTGTFPFLSIEILEWDPKQTGHYLHTYYDDLQSFFFVLIWLCSEPTSQLAKWSSDRSVAAAAKFSQVVDEINFRNLLGGFRNDTAQLKDLVWGLRDILWPGWRRLDKANVNLTNETVRDKFYGNIDKEFRCTIAALGGIVTGMDEKDNGAK
ncbi:hypothetical protein BDD12DRAFT_896759 [Trichophaea hybrida]|nr:hypothetical protein BDD12DRAFT_896759 [Trichophaea hybrida]